MTEGIYVELESPVGPRVLYPSKFTLETIEAELTGPWTIDDETPHVDVGYDSAHDCRRMAAPLRRRYSERVEQLMQLRCGCGRAVDGVTTFPSPDQIGTDDWVGWTGYYGIQTYRRTPEGLRGCCSQQEGELTDRGVRMAVLHQLRFLVAQRLQALLDDRAALSRALAADVGLHASTRTDLERGIREIDEAIVLLEDRRGELGDLESWVYAEESA